MFIQTNPRPTPQTLKFLPGQTVLEMGTRRFSRPPKQQSGIALGHASVRPVEGVTGVFFGTDFVTITQGEPGSSGDQPETRPAWRDHGAFPSARPLIEKGHDTPSGTQNTPAKTVRIVGQIKENGWDSRVRPCCAKMAAILTFHALSAVLYTFIMQGACAGCPIVPH